MDKKLTKSLVLLFTASLVLCSCSQNTQNTFVRELDYTGPIRLACIGDSITFGYGIQDREKNSYPAQLGTMLGSRWDVRNFGVSGATLLKKGDRPYWDQTAFKKALEFNPNVVVIMLGTNDSKPINWKYKDEYVSDYIDLIRQFEALEAKPRIWICSLVPAYPERWGITEQVMTEEITPRIDEVARKTGVPVIDLHTALSDKAQMFPDRIHPNAEGAKLMSEAICQALTGRVAIVKWQVAFNLLDS